MVDIADRVSDHGNGDGLNVGRLDEVHLEDSANDLRRDGEIVLVVPRLSLVDEYARDILGVSILNKLNTFSSLVSQGLMLRRDRTVVLFLLLLLFLFLSSGSLRSHGLRLFGLHVDFCFIYSNTLFHSLKEPIIAKY